jgi:acetyltransferase-like isoleucine patch superfamily enzyme
MNNISYYLFKLQKKLRGKALSNSTIHITSKVEAGSEVVNSNFDKYSFCGYNCSLVNVDIGSFCSISNNVVMGGGMHPMEWVSTSPVFYYGRDSVTKKFSEFKRVEPSRIKVGNDVWIGQSVIVKQGVTIGTGSVIGMGSIVTKDVEPYSIVAGNPARLIRMRFEKDIIEDLMNSQWWNMPEDKLHSAAKYIQNPRQFLEELRK